MEDNERVLNRDGVDALWGRTKDLVEDRVGLMELPEYDSTSPHSRGESFRVLVGGKWKGYRMKVSQDAGQESWPWDVAECERLNLYTLSQPLRMRQGTIKTICK